MKQLDKHIEVSGCGITGLTADLIKRQGRVVIYLRSDGYYESGRLPEYPDEDIRGRHYPAREGYFTNEQFGMDCWTTRDRNVAEIHFQRALRLKL